MTLRLFELQQQRDHSPQRRLLPPSQLGYPVLEASHKDLSKQTLRPQLGVGVKELRSSVDEITQEAGAARKHEMSHVACSEATSWTEKWGLVPGWRVSEMNKGERSVHYFIFLIYL